MHRSFSLPPLISGAKGKGHSPSSENTSELQSRTPQLPRMSVLTSVKLPSLRRSEAESSSSTTPKKPLLTLRLSSYSFLDSTLKDDASQPLYTTRTSGMTTSILRTDPWDISIKIADIKWPKIVPAKAKSKDVLDNVLVQLAGSRWKGGDSFLKRSSSTNGPRKFNIPYYSHSMKWQKQGTAHWCTSPPVKGPIAIFDPPVDHLPGRLTIYETLHDKYETSPMLVHQGVSILLLDYLLVTAILLVTDPQEWMLVQTQGPSSSSASDSQHNASRKWRKIAHREPLFTKLFPASTTTSAGRGDFTVNPTTPTCQDQTGSVMHREPIHPNIHPGSKSILSFSSDSDLEDDNGPRVVPCSSSLNPSTGSFHSPLTPNRSTTVHTYIDPSFDHSEGVPPVPPLPVPYADQSRSLSPASISIDSRQTRELPAPPALVERSRSRADLLRAFEELHTSAVSSSNTGPADASLWKRRPSEPVVTRSRSTSRPLPRTPTARGTDIHTQVVRRIHSHSRIGQTGIEKPWLSTSATNSQQIPPTPTVRRTYRQMRTLPPTPFDVEMGRSEGGTRTTVSIAGLQNKSSDSDEWTELVGTEQDHTDALPRPSFDHPPPAYSSIDFNLETWTRGL